MASVLDAVDDTTPGAFEPPGGLTVGDLYRLFGPIPLRRIVLDPLPGTATFDDLVAFHERTGRYCELVDGILVEKDVSYKASRLAAKLIGRLQPFVERHNLGVVAGEQGFLRLAKGRVRGPDVSFIGWDRLPGGREPEEPIPGLAPTLAVEVVSPGNTKKEMEEKLRDYFRSGVPLVWYVYPEREQVVVYRGPESQTLLGEGDTLDGEEVLPGFALSLAELFVKPTAER